MHAHSASVCNPRNQRTQVGIGSFLHHTRVQSVCHSPHSHVRKVCLRHFYLGNPPHETPGPLISFMMRDSWSFSGLDGPGPPLFLLRYICVPPLEGDFPPSGAPSSSPSPFGCGGVEFFQVGEGGSRLFRRPLSFPLQDFLSRHSTYKRSFEPQRKHLPSRWKRSSSFFGHGLLGRQFSGRVPFSGRVLLCAWLTCLA